MAVPDWIEQAIELGRTLGFRVLAHEPMSRHTSFRVGGPADLLADPAQPEHVRALRSFAGERGAPFTLIGAGTNLVVRDGGIRGIVCRIGPAMSSIEPLTDGCGLRAQAGALLGRISLAAMREAMSGMEWAVGIPGNLGGAVFMNAGAHGGAISDVLTCALTLSGDCEFTRWTPQNLGFAYRTSALQGTGHIVLEAELGLTPGDPEAIAAAHEDILGRRRAAQPLDLPSAGSVFKRPPGDYAGRLIEASGLRGTARVGGAMVSEKHAGFIVNTGGATAADILALIDLVQRTVIEKTGVDLEPEVRVVGEDA